MKLTPFHQCIVSLTNELLTDIPSRKREYKRSKGLEIAVDVAAQTASQ